MGKRPIVNMMVFVGIFGLSAQFVSCKLLFKIEAFSCVGLCCLAWRGFSVKELGGEK